MRYVVERMTMADIPRVVEVERLAYTTPWPPSAYRKELEENQHSHYIVVRDTYIKAGTEVEPATPPAHLRRPFPLSLLPGRTPQTPNPNLASIVGFAGQWLMLDEVHITTIATHPDYRGRGLGELLLSSLIAIAYDIRAERVTLEVRVSNSVAQSLYRKYGFIVVGTRRRYYSDNNEDAYIMTTENINSQGYRALYGRLQTQLIERLAADEQSTSTARWTSAEN
ncbi:MAG: ribosomal protein S18-alanine N-acetyltransferase [Ktedonobacterales bacterium]